MDYITKSILVGMVGDACLQSIVYSSREENKFGLRTYFEAEGHVSSLFIAGGMLGFFSSIYVALDPSLSILGMSLYGAILDEAFREFHIMPQLDDYYAHFDRFQTILFAIVPFVASRVL